MLVIKHLESRRVKFLLACISLDNFDVHHGYTMFERMSADKAMVYFRPKGIVMDLCPLQSYGTFRTLFVWETNVGF